METEDGQIQENRYDAEGLRFELLENGKRTRFVYHQGELLHEEGGDESQSSYHLGAGVEALRRGRENYYYHHDEQLSTALITGSNGSIHNTYQFDAFGVELEKTEQLSNRIRYTGQQYDSLTDQYYLRARYYNPVLGRFMQEDVYQGDGLNLYAYCNNNPVMYTDPSGYATKYEEAKHDTGMGDKQVSEVGADPESSNTVPNDTYIFGNSEKPADARPEKDFKVQSGSDVVSAQSPPLPKGKSVCINPDTAPLVGHYYKVPAGTELPDGLAIVYDGKDVVPGGHFIGHSTIYPTRDMTVDEFNGLLQSMPWQHDGKKK